MHWSSPYPPAVYWLALAGAAALLFAARRLAISPKLGHWTLLAPRGMALGALLVILLHPVQRSEQQLPPKPAEIAYLIDTSRSMALDSPVRRLDQVKQAIVEAERRIPPDARPRAQVFRFGEQLAAAADLGALQPSDNASRLSDALSRLPSRLSHRAPQAVVVFSDGAFDLTRDAVELAEGYAKMGVPLHVFGVGDATLQGDVAIADLTLPRRVAPREQAPVRAVVRSFGFAGRRVVMEIRPKGRADASPLASLPITLEDGEQTCELVLEVDPDLGELEIVAPLQPGEAITSNNRVPFRLASKSRKIRVLYMEGTHNNEYRWIRDALHEDPDIECVPMVVHHQYAERPRLQRIDDPLKGYPSTRDELFSFDVVICSDISQTAFTREQIDWTVELVAQRGGGFAMIGGHTSYGSGGWDRTEWEKLIPFDMAGRRDFLGHVFQVRVPEAALPHPIWRLHEDPRESRRAIESMPVFYGTNLISRVKPAATLLAESAAPLPMVNVMPIMASQSFGRGRTFALSSDSTADWGRDFESRWGEGDNRHFRKFWRNVIRWLSENSIAGSKRLFVETDKVIYRPGEPIQITAQAFDEGMTPTLAYRVTAQPMGEEATPAVSLAPSSAEGRYRGELPATLRVGPATPQGLDAFLQPLLVEVAAFDGPREIARPIVEALVLDDSPELLRVQAQPQNLAPLAERSGGQVMRSSADLAALLHSLRPSDGEKVTHQAPLWDRPWIWGAIVALLAVEWTLRRRAGFG